MHIFVGSSNPVKVGSVLEAIKDTWPNGVVQGIEVVSGVAEQPRSDEETKLGASNRARNVLKKGLSSLNNKPNEVLGVGLEGGVFEDVNGVMWSTVWAVVVDKTGYMQSVNGARFRVPVVVADRIKAGEEMGPIIANLVGEDDVKRKQGMIGVITDNFITRTQEYVGIVKLALGLWYGRDWESKLKD